MVDDKENQPRSVFKKDHHHHHHPKPLESASVFDDHGEVSINLKKPKDEGDVDHEEDNNDEKNIRICQVCNKVFGSGKALGGHMRIHVQAYQKQLISKKKLKAAKESIKLKKYKPQQVNVEFGKNKDFTKSDNVKKKKPKCVLCGKNFPSMKSLFGHMRCHPERDWRGIEPPPPAAKNSSSSSLLDAEPPPENVDDGIDSTGTNDELGSAVDSTTEPFPTWSVTGKRGRKPAAISNPDGDQFRAARSLMLLRDHTQKGQEFEATKIKSPDGFIDDHHTLMQNHEQKGSSDGVEGLQASGVINNNCVSTNQVIVIKSKKKRKKMKLRPLQHVEDANQVQQITPVMMATNAATPDKYKCSTCDKCLPTHQALGGHRSSHKKFKMDINNSIDDASSAAAAMEEDENLANNNPIISQVEENKESEDAAGSSKMVEGTHQCNICNKLFASGQALGGHKRCHWNGAPMEAAQSSQVMSPGEVSHIGGRILDFDLNETPPMEDDEAGVDSDQQVAGYGYASFSCDLVA